MIQRLSWLASLILLLGAGSGMWAQTNMSGAATSGGSTTIAVSGTVLEGDMPLPGVSVTVKGSYAGTSTDLDGRFSLSVASGSTLVFSYIGYLRQEVTVTNTVSDLKVSLKPDVAGLEEAVVIGYGNQQRSKISGAVTTVDIKEATSIPVLRTEQALQGRAAGVQVTQNSGQPGSTPTIRIRGLGSINNSEPLFIVDGIPSGGIDYLNPSDIESISILKDAASAAIYGARGGNGVVVITTKKGARNSNATLTYDSYYGIQEPWKLMSLLNAEEYATLINEGRAANGMSALEGIEYPAELGEGTNWQRELFSRAPMSSQSVRYTNGTANSSMALSASQFRQEGIVGGEKDGYERTTVRLTSDQNAGERFKIGQVVSFTATEDQVIADNSEFVSPVFRALNFDPVTEAVRQDGSYTYALYSRSSDIQNPLNQIALSNDVYNTNRFVGNVWGEWRLLPELKFKSSVNADVSFQERVNFLPSYDLALFEGDPNRPPWDTRVVNSVGKEHRTWKGWQWENYATYTVNLEEDRKVDVVGGYSASLYSYNFLGASRDSLASNDPNLAYLANTITFTPQPLRGIDDFSENAWIGQFIRGAYTGKEWSLTATVRRDGSSRFGPQKRYGIFPSFSAAWNLTERPWFDEKDWIDLFKVRGSWGRNGNAEIGEYGYIPRIVNGINYTFGTSQLQTLGSGQYAVANPELGWETMEQFNLGLDADFFEGRLNVIFDVFEKNTLDMLAYVPVPGTVGFEPGPSNVASARNRGLELALGYQGGEGDFTYDVNGNISFYKNEVTDLGASVDSLNTPIFTGQVFGTGNDFVAISDIGLPMASFYGYETAGIFQTQEEAENSIQENASAGDVIFVDQNDDGVINADDKVVLGSPHPVFTYGLNFGANWKGLDATLFLQGSYGNDLYLGMFRYDLGTSNLPSWMLDRWVGEGTSDDVPRMTASDANQNNRVSDRFIEDGSYLRIKSLQLGYTLPSGTLNSLGISKLRIYTSATNLFTFTSYSGLDPEIGTRGTLEIGIDRGFYPSPRIFQMGLSATF